MKWLKRILRTGHMRQSTFPSHVHGLRVPEQLLELVVSNRWPADYRLDTSSLAERSGLPFLDDLDVSLLGDTAILANANASLVKGAPDSWENTALGSKVAAPIKLSQLDVEKAFCFGGGADWGDDLWLCLDYRANSEQPRVVCNEYTDNGALWRVVSDNFLEFCECLGLNDDSWRTGRYGGCSKYSAFYYEGR